MGNTSDWLVKKFASTNQRHPNLGSGTSSGFPQVARDFSKSCSKVAKIKSNLLFESKVAQKNKNPFLLLSPLIWSNAKVYMQILQQKYQVFQEFCAILRCNQRCLIILSSKKNVWVKAIFFISWIFLHFAFSWNLSDFLHLRHSSQSSVNLRQSFWIFFKKSRWPSSPAGYVHLVPIVILASAGRIWLLSHGEFRS